MRIVIVPDWILTPLRLAKATHRDLWPPTMSSASTEPQNAPAANVLSTEDLALWSVLNDFAGDLFPPALKETFSTYTWAWTQSPSFGPLVEQFTTLYKAGIDPHKLSLLCENVHPDLSQSSAFKQGYELGFDVLDEQDDVFYVRLKAVSSLDMLNSYDQLFAILSKKYGMEKIVALPLFADYEKRLAIAARCGSNVA